MCDFSVPNADKGWELAQWTGGERTWRGTAGFSGSPVSRSTLIHKGLTSRGLVVPVGGRIVSLGFEHRIVCLHSYSYLSQDSLSALPTLYSSVESWPFFHLWMLWREAQSTRKLPNELCWRKMEKIQGNPIHFSGTYPAETPMGLGPRFLHLQRNRGKDYVPLLEKVLILMTWKLHSGPRHFPDRICLGFCFVPSSPSVLCFSTTESAVRVNLSI